VNALCRLVARSVHNLVDQTMQPLQLLARDEHRYLKRHLDRSQTLREFVVLWCGASVAWVVLVHVRNPPSQLMSNNSGCSLVKSTSRRCPSLRAVTPVCRSCGDRRAYLGVLPATGMLASPAPRESRPRTDRTPGRSTARTHP